MRRVHDRSRASFFRGAELARLLTLVAMLGVLYMLMQRARDPQTWSWFAANDTPPPAAQTPKPPQPDSEPVTPPSGPTDLDPQEQDAAREELSVVTDRAPLAPAEMLAYWRLMAWQLRQTTAAMQQRADKHVTYRDLWNEPDRYRGKLVELRVHLRRVLTVDEVAANDLGVKRLYEVFGWNDSSQPYVYWMIVDDLPADMPKGDNIYEEGTFVGYFLKLLPYEDREGHYRATPLLIGRLVWHPSPHDPLSAGDDWSWTWYLGAALLAVFVLRWGLVFWNRSRKVSPLEASIGSADDRAVESWLSSDQGSDDSADPEDSDVDWRENEP